MKNRRVRLNLVLSLWAALTALPAIARGEEQSKAIGIDVGGTKVAAAVVAFDSSGGAQLERTVERPLSGTDVRSVAEASEALVHELVGSQPIRKAVDLPGFTTEGGLMVLAPNLAKDWQGVRFGDVLADRLGMEPGSIPAVNDGVAAGMCELLPRIGVDDQNVTGAAFGRSGQTHIYVPGTGLLAVGLEGLRLIAQEGGHRQVAEVPRTLDRISQLAATSRIHDSQGVVPFEQCGCGGKNCLESFWGGAQLEAMGAAIERQFRDGYIGYELREAAKRNGGRIFWGDLAAIAARHDPHDPRGAEGWREGPYLTHHALQELIGILALDAANQVNRRPDLSHTIVIGGHVIQTPGFVDQFRNAVNERLSGMVRVGMEKLGTTVAVVPSELGRLKTGAPQLVGAAYVGMTHTKAAH